MSTYTYNSDQYSKSAAEELGEAYVSSYEVLEEHNLVISILSTTYSLKYILDSMSFIYDVMSSPYDMESCLKLVRHFGRIVEKLKIYPNDYYLPNIRHLYGTFCYCSKLINRGYTIHLIESIDSTGLKKMGDIDIFSSKDGQLLLVDYSQFKNMDVEKLNLDNKLHVLSQKFQNVAYNYQVSSCKLPTILLEHKMADQVTINTNFSLEFQKVENMISVAHEMSQDQTKIIINDYVEKISAIETNQSCVRLLSKGIGNFENSFVPVARMISSNDVDSANTFKTILMSHLVSEKAIKDYSLDLFEKWELSPEKPIFNFQNSSRHVGITDNNPFSRLKLIISSNTKLGIDSHPLIRLISMSEDGEIHPNEEEENYCLHHPLHHMFKRVKCQRLRHKKTKELIDAVTLHFEDSLYCSLESVSFGNSKTKAEIKTLRSSNTVHTYPELEDRLKQVEEWGESLGNGSRFYEEIDDLIDCVLPDSNVANTIRNMMSLVLQPLMKSKLGSILSQTQEVAMSVCNAPRKKRLIKTNHAGFKKTSCNLSLDCVTDRFLVAITNMSSTLNTHKDQTVAVAGVFPFEKNILARSCDYGLSEWFGLSAADLDWHVTLSHKLLSWLALEIEETLINIKKPPISEIVKLVMSPCLIMMINDKKFAQASEMVRYVFVNSTGISGGTKELYDKVNWFLPDNMMSKLYVLRMIKMSTGLQWMKAHQKGKMLHTLYSNTYESSEFTKTFRFSHWNVAFPHEHKSVPSDLHVYNSFYICKVFTVERHNKIQSEALVIQKQLDARKDYLDVLEKNLSHETKYLPHFQNVDQLIDFCLSRRYENQKTEAYSPDPIVVLIGSLCAINKTSGKYNRLKDVVDKQYPSRELPRLLKLTDIMNNHGSVASKGTHGVITTNATNIDYVNNDKVIKKKSIITQNDKAYHTLLRDVHDFVTNSSPKPFVENWCDVTTEYEDKDKTTDEQVLASSLRANNLIWPLMLRHISQKTQFVSKMTHKDQIGEREIATLNAASRICCYFVEEFSRMIRTQEHKMGNTVNLIERTDKETLVKTAYSKSRLSHNEGKTIVYDSADCSKWGPSMLTYILYISIGIRISDVSVRNMVKLCLQLFSNKVFKIPDYFFLSMDIHNLNELETNAVNKARANLRAMSEKVGNIEKQIIYLPESMHQGILGASSSVLGADLLHLSNLVVNESTKGQVLVTSFCTSDDYTRILTISSEHDEDSLTGIIKRTLSWHMKVSNDFGIKRNMQKSTHNIHVMEFNSVFYSSNSENRPDIKSRLSYVDFPHSYDPYPGALETLNKGLEFLRMEGSLYGACWVQTLNSHLHLLQNQGLPLFNILKRNIFRVPLELGGLVAIDPIMAIQSSQFLPLVENYCPTDEWVAQAAMSVMMDMRPTEVAEISADPEDEMKSVIPKMSRSGTINLCRRDKQTSRKVREFLRLIPRQNFIDLRFPGSRYGLLPTLMSCMQREEAASLGETSSIRYAVAQTPMHLDMFKVNSRLLKEMFQKDRVSRHDLHELAVSWVNMRANKTLNTKMLELNVPTIQLPLFYETFEAERHNYLNRIKRIEIIKIMAINKRPHYHPLRESFVPSTWYDLSVEDFCREYKPEELGGHSDIHPALFLESLMMYKAKLRDLTQRKQMLKLVLMETDSDVTSVVDLILLGSFMSGARVMFTASQLYEQKRYVEDNISHLMKIFSKPNWDQHWSTHGTLKWDVLDDRIHALYSKQQLSAFDLTNLLNATTGESENLTFSDHRSKSEVWHTVNDAFRKTQIGKKLVIKPYDVKFNKRNNVFHMGSHHSLYSNALINSANRVIGRETIQQATSGTYHHWYFVHRDSEFEMPHDTLSDKHYLMYVADVEYLTVKLKNVSGFLMLVTTNDFPISVLCPALPDEKETIHVHCRGQLLTKNIILKLNLQNYGRDNSRALDKILTSKLMLYHEDDELAEEIDRIKHLEESDINFLDTVNVLSDNVLENALADILGMSDDCSEDEEETEEEENKTEEESESEIEEVTRWSQYSGSEFDEEESPEPEFYHAGIVEEPDIEYLRPRTDSSYLSQHGVFQSTATILSTRAYGGIKRYLGLRKNIKYAVKNEITYELTVPFKTKDKAYASGDSGTGLEELLEELMNDRSVDAAWHVAYLRDCLVNDPKIMSTVEDIMNAVDEQEEDW